MQVPLLMKTLDDDGDGHVSFEEFRVGLQDFLIDPDDPGLLNFISRCVLFSFDTTDLSVCPYLISIILITFRRLLHCLHDHTANILYNMFHITIHIT